MAHTALFKLPDELLIKVAYHLDVANLLTLSVTCRRFSNIAQEVLVSTGTLSIKNTTRLIETLESKPGLCKALRHVRLGKLKFKFLYEVCPPKKPGTWEDACDELYTGYLESETPADMNIILQSEAYLSARLAKLFALSAGPNSISMGARSIEVIPLLTSCFNGTVLKYPRRMLDWFEQVRNDFQKQLEVLEIVPENYQKAPFHQDAWSEVFIDLTQFDRLKQIIVPFDMISWRPTILPGSNLSIKSRLQATDPLQVLPRSLELMRLMIDTRTTFRGFTKSHLTWVDQLVKANSVLTKLQHVELRFDLGILRTTSMLIEENGVAPAFLTKLEAWKQGRVAVTTTFLDTNALRDFPKPATDGVIYEYLQGDFAAALSDALNKPDTSL